MPALVCEDRARLLNEYSRATLAFSARVDELAQKAGTVRKAEYIRLTNAVGEARTATEQAHFNLEKHITDHGCASDNDST